VTKPLIHGKKVIVPLSFEVRKALGDALGAIRAEEGYTWAQLGELIGKSDDQATKYVDTTAEMGVVAYHIAKARWGSRFTGRADALLDPQETTDPYQAQSCILKAALALSVALEDGRLTDTEIRQNRSTLEGARDAIDAVLARLTPRQVVA
jgi:hypothetical protein